MIAKAPDSFAIALAQLNPVMGDIPGNLARARDARAEAPTAGADLILFSELFITGYPPEDLVLKPVFQADAMQAVEDLAKDTADGGPAVLIGTPWVKDGALYNAVAYLDGGAVQATTFKADLPNYGVFDEKRVFTPGPHAGTARHSRRAHRRSDLRGHLGRRPRGMPVRDGRGDFAGAERLALRFAQTRSSAERDGRARRAKRRFRWSI